MLSSSRGSKIGTVSSWCLFSKMALPDRQLSVRIIVYDDIKNVTSERRGPAPPSGLQMKHGIEDGGRNFEAGEVRCSISAIQDTGRMRIFHEHLQRASKRLTPWLERDYIIHELT